MGALTPLGASAQARQIGLGSRFVQKDQTRRIEAALPPPPCLACPDQIGPILLTGPECLFLYVSPIRASTT
jgi:hypothetical protein